MTLNWWDRLQLKFSFNSRFKRAYQHQHSASCVCFLRKCMQTVPVSRLRIATCVFVVRHV